MIQVPGFATTNEFTRRILHEVYWGTVVEGAPLLFSLHFNKDGLLYPVLHPYYQCTLVGRVFAFLDYFLKGFVNGGVYSEEFLLQWHTTRNTDREYLKRNVVDVRKQLAGKLSGGHKYQSLRELLDDPDEEPQPSTTADGANPKKSLQYLSAFRILGALRELRKDGNYFIPEAAFDVEHDLYPSAEMASKLAEKGGEDTRRKHKQRQEAYQRMHDAIETIMPKVPMFTPYFELLKVICFAAHYVQSLRECGMVPCIAQRPPPLPPFPSALPPIPVRKVERFPVTLTLGEFSTAPFVRKLDQLLCDIIYERKCTFTEIEPDIAQFSSQLLRQKLKAFPNAGSVDDHGDDELKVPASVAHLLALLRVILTKKNAEFESLLDQFKEIEGSKQLRHEISKLPTFQMRAEKFVEALNTLLRKHLENRRKNYNSQLEQARREIASQVESAFQKNIAQIDQQCSEASRAIEQGYQSSLQHINQQVTEAHSDINSKASNVPAGYTVNHTALQNARIDIDRQAQGMRDSAAQRRTEAYAELQREVDRLKQSARTEIDGKKATVLADVQKQHTQEIATLEKELQEMPTKIKESVAQIELSTRTMFTDLLKNTSAQSFNVCDGLRLSCLHVESTSWSETIVGGCSVSAHSQPTLNEQSFPVHLKDEFAVHPTGTERIIPLLSDNYLMFDWTVDSGLDSTGEAYALVPATDPVDAAPKNAMVLDMIGATSGTVASWKGPLDFLVECSNLELAQKFLLGQKDPALIVNRVPANGVPPLLTAIANRDLPMVKLLVQFGANINFTHANGLTPLLMAAQSGAHEIIGIILDKPGVNIDATLDDGMSAMHFAIMHDDRQAVKRLSALNFPADKFPRRKDGCSPWNYAASLGQLECLRHLRVSDVNIASPNGNTALHYAAAASQNSAGCVKYLLALKGISTTTVNRLKQTPLMVALLHRNDQSAILMAAHDASSLTLRNEDNERAIDIAARLHAHSFLSYYCVKFPKERSNVVGTIPKSKSGLAKSSESIIGAIMRKSAPDLSRLLKQLDAVRRATGKKATPADILPYVEACITVMSLEMLDFVVRAVPDISQVRFSEDRALSHIVVQAGITSWVERLAKWSFSFTELDAAMKTPLHYAVLADDKATVLALLSSTQPENREGLFQAALQQAFEQRKKQCLEGLLSRAGIEKIKVAVKGTYLCQSAEVQPKDIALARLGNVSFVKSDVVAAAERCNPETLLSILKTPGISDEVLDGAIEAAAKAQRLGNIAALYSVAPARCRAAAASCSGWVKEALFGDPQHNISNRIAAIAHLLSEGVDIHAGTLDDTTGLRDRGIRRQMGELLHGFPLRNQGVVGQLPYMHVAMQHGALWALDCIPEGYDVSQTVFDTTAFDCLALLPGAIVEQLDHVYSKFTFSKVLSNITRNFAMLCKKKGTSAAFISKLAEHAHESNNTTILHILIAAGITAEEVKRIIDKNPSFCSALDSDRCTPLMVAVNCASADVALLLISHPETQLFQFNHKGESALNLLLKSEVQGDALSRLALEMLNLDDRLLMKRDRDGVTAWTLAAARGHTSLLAAIASAYPPSHAQCVLALNAAAMHNQTQTIRFIVDVLGIRVNAELPADEPLSETQTAGDTALHAAAKGSASQAFVMLASCGGNVLQRNADKETPVELALQSGCEALMSACGSFLQLINSPSHRGAFVIACVKGSRTNDSILRMLLSLGFPAASFDEHGNSALHYAAACGNSAVVDALLDYGVAINTVDRRNRTALHLSAELGVTNTLRLLLQRALETGVLAELQNTVDHDGNTALHVAVKGQRAECVATLLAHGADTSLANKIRLTAGNVAAIGGSLSCATVLIAHGDRSSLDEASKYPLEYQGRVSDWILNHGQDLRRVGTGQGKVALVFLEQRKASLERMAEEKRHREASQMAPSSTNTALLAPQLGTTSATIRDLCECTEKEALTILDSGVLESPMVLLKFVVLKKNATCAASVKRLVKLLASQKFPRRLLTDSLPLLPEKAFPAFVSIIETTHALASSVSAEHQDVIWEWFFAYFTAQFIPTTQLDIDVACFDTFLKLCDITHLPSPTLSSLCGYLGTRCSLPTVNLALNLAANRQIQCRCINDTPLCKDFISTMKAAGACCFLNSAMFISAQDRILVENLPLTVPQRSWMQSISQTLFHRGSSAAPKLSLTLAESVSRASLLAMQHGSLAVIDLLHDLRDDLTLAPDAKQLIHDSVSLVQPSNFSMIRAWGAAATMVQHHAGDKALAALCESISPTNPLDKVLELCALIVKIQDVTKIHVALQSKNPKNELQRLLQAEQPEKSIDTLLLEMSTASMKQFAPHEYPFDGTPLQCLSDAEIAALRMVHAAFVKHSPPNNSSDVREAVQLLGQRLRENPDEVTIGQLLSVLAHAFDLVYKMKPDLIQVITVAAMLLSEISQAKASNGLKGRIAQVATGEGKSINVALLAAACAAQGRCVDVITSTHYLAARDHKRFQPYFKFVGVSSSSVAVEPHPTAKDFDGMILYGINTDFEFAILREGVQAEHIQLTSINGKRVPRAPDTIITDESDNMFLDTALNAARLAWNARRCTSWVYAPILEHVRAQSLLASPVTLRRVLSAYNGAKYSADVAHFSDAMLTKWLSSCKSSMSRTKGHDYVVRPNEETGRLEVQIVHLGTGRIQVGSRWSGGVHEFIEAREGLVPESENLTIASISHPAYFGRYRRVYGLTGTAGEPVERQETESTYHVDLFDVPPHRPCQRQRLPSTLVGNKVELHRRVKQRIDEVRRQGRPVLVLLLTINDSVEFSNALREQKVTHNVLNEMQREDEDFVVFKAGQPGAVTLATNTAGRGTDIVLSPEVRTNGGLHVIFTFFPENFRVECQGLGRAGRQGDRGTAEIIMARDDPFVKELAGPHADQASVEGLYRDRTIAVTLQSHTRQQRCRFETQLYAQLKTFFTGFHSVLARFNDPGVEHVLRDAFPQLEPQQLRSLVMASLQQRWAQTFTQMTECHQEELLRAQGEAFVAKHIAPVLLAHASNNTQLPLIVKQLLREDME